MKFENVTVILHFYITKPKLIKRKLSNWFHRSSITFKSLGALDISNLENILITN